MIIFIINSINVSCVINIGNFSNIIVRW
jgi:hypothetical protein